MAKVLNRRTKKAHPLPKDCNVCARNSFFEETPIELGKGGGSTGYRKINVELVVFAEDADAVVSALDLAIDQLEETHTIFGGGIEVVPVEHSGMRRKSALRHTLAAGNTAKSAVKVAPQKVVDAYKKVI